MKDKVPETAFFIDNTKRAIARIEAEPEDNIDLARYRVDRPCGTVFCAAGLLATDPYFQSLGMHMVKRGDVWHMRFKDPKATEGDLDGELSSSEFGFDSIFGGEGVFATLFTTRHVGWADMALASYRLTDKELALARFRYHLKQLENGKDASVELLLNAGHRGYTEATDYVPNDVLTTAGLVTFGLTNNPNAPLTSVLDSWDQGMTGLISEVLGVYAPRLCTIIEVCCEAGYEAPGVYDYEVSEEFGGLIGEYILANDGQLPDNDVAHAMIDSLVLRFYEEGPKAPELDAYLTGVLRAVRETT